MKRLIGTAAAALLLLAACASPGSTAAPTASSAPASAAAPTAVAVTLMDFKITPATTTVSGNVEFDVHSDGPTPHNFTIRDASNNVVLHSKDLRAGESDTVSGQLTPGTYTFFCAFPGHESLGMHGTLTVTP